jgi:creatinine amidohydrolase
MRLPEQTTTTAATAFEDASVAVLPVGSTEQHGPALPLGTDFQIAEAFARTLSSRDDVTVLPTLPVGVSEHHRQFHGTLWTSPDTFEAYVTETVESIASHGIRKAVIVNGHGGNIDALERAARVLRRDETAFAPTWNWWESIPDLSEDLFETEGGHAGPAETSLVYEVAEELVREDALEAAGDDAPDSWGKSVHGASVGFDTIDFTPTGAVGDPTEASREAGDTLFENASDELDALVDWLVEQSFEELLPKNHR